MSDANVHWPHVPKVLTLISECKLYADLMNCIFVAGQLPLLSSFSVKGVRSDLEILGRSPSVSRKSLSRDFESALG